MKILVVDDEPLIRTLFKDALASVKGVEVVCERSGFRAMARVNQESFDVLFTDIMMPGLNGLQTIDEVLQIQPDLHIIVITGYANDAILEEAVEKGAKACMHKPFGITEICDAVEQVRSSQEGAGEQAAPAE